MVGKKKKRDKTLGLSLTRIGSSLVPNAIFSAVPRTAQSLSETWPRRTKNLPRLSGALGSVGNVAQAFVVASSPSPKEEFDNSGNGSSARHEQEEDNESEGHYAEVDETILGNSAQKGKVDDKGKEDLISAEAQKDVIYATVNKRRKPQIVQEEKGEESLESEDDITSVSGMGSDDDDDYHDDDEDEDSTSTYGHQPSTSKQTAKRQESRKRKISKVKSKGHSPRHAFPKVIEEEPVTKTDINDNLLSNADFADGPRYPTLPEEYNNNYKTTTIHDSTTEDMSRSIENFNQGTVGETNSRHEIYRNYHCQTEFEREQFNETNLDEYSDEESPRFVSTRREEEPIGANTLDLVDNCPEVPPIGERETPIGKGLSSENIAVFKEQWHNLGQLAVKQEGFHKQLNDRKLKQKEEKDIFKEQILEERHLSKIPTTRLSMSPGRTLKNKRSTETSGLNIANERHADQEETQDQGEKDHFQPGENEPQDQQAIIRRDTRKQEKKKKNRKQLKDIVHEVKNEHSMSARQREDPSFTDDVVSEEKTIHSRAYEEKSSKIRKRKTRHAEKEENKQHHDSPTDTLKRMSTTLAKETCRKLRMQVKVLDREKTALESLSQSLNEENTTLKKLTQSLTARNQETSAGIPVTLLQLQIEELKQENNFLKDSVHRLNVELGRYQAKFRPLLSQEVDAMFETGDSKPAWLVNKKYISPLLLAYDDRMKEKQAIIKAYEDEFQSFKERVDEIVQENVKLRERLDSSEGSLRDKEEWSQLEEQAKLVLEENAVLMERQDMQNTKMEELRSFYEEEVSRLSKRYTTCESEKGVLESKLEVVSTSLNGLKQELETSTSEWKKHVPLDEHLGTVNDCRRKLEELRKKTQNEMESLKFQLEAIKNENNNLTRQLADYKVANTQLEREVHNFTEIQRKNQRKTLLLKEKLGHVLEREATAQNTLSEVLNVAEKTSSERDALNEMLANKQLENKKVQSLVKLEEDKLKECKNKACYKIAAVEGRVKEQERVTEKLRDSYENEIKSLKTLIRRQQRQLEDMVNEKRNMENELNVIYQKVGAEGLEKNFVT